MIQALAQLLAFALQAAPASGAPPPETLAIEHVSVLTMADAQVLPDQTVVVRDGRIAALGPAAAASVPEDARHIDGHGKFLMPGLADMHVHVWDENDLFLFVANGVTTVRNMFGAELHLGWRKRIEAGELVGPRIYTAGPIIDGKPAVWPGSVELTDPEQAAGVVRSQKEAGYDFLKPYAMLTRECYEALAVAGEEQGMLLMGHVPEALGLEDVLDAHQHTIEHLGGYAEAAQRADSPHRTVSFTNESAAWKHVDDARLAERARATQAAGSWNCPTLVVMQKWALGDDARALLARPEMRYVSPFIKSGFQPDSPMNYLAHMPVGMVRAAHEALPFEERAVRALRDAGAGLIAGTDMGNPFVLAGFALHEELAFLVAAGLTPFEALRASTADAARCMGAEKDWGTVAVGRRADLLLLTASPLDDVRNAAQRAGVVVHGRWFSEEDLKAELEKRAQAFEAKEKR
jgi:imidazolonepropionase-like amidohydrolase